MIVIDCLYRAEGIVDKYDDNLGYLVRMSDGHDYGRDASLAIAEDCARRLKGVVYAWGQHIGGDRSPYGGWYPIKDYQGLPS